MEREKRNNKISLDFTDSELKLIDSFRDKRQMVTKGKVSRSDAIVGAVKFATGSLILTNKK